MSYWFSLNDIWIIIPGNGITQSFIQVFGCRPEAGVVDVEWNRKKKKKKKMLTCSSKFNTDSLCAGFVVCVQRDTGKKKSIKRQKMISH